jgi:serine/threonine protein kinase
VNWTVFPQQDLKKEIRHMETLDEQGMDLLYKLLEYDPTMRLSAVQALRHPYFNDVKLPA